MSGEAIPSALPCPSPGSLSHTAPPHPPNPKDAGYLTPGCLATVMPGRGVGVWPEAALIREWRDGGRRVQGDVGFGEGWPRWARFLRQREAKALGGRRAATVRAEERISRSQTVLTYEARPRPGHHTPTLAWQSSRSTGSPVPVSSTEPLLPAPPHCSPLFQSSLSTAPPTITPGLSHPVPLPLSPLPVPHLASPCPDTLWPHLSSTLSSFGGEQSLPSEPGDSLPIYHQCLL